MRSPLSSLVLSCMLAIAGCSSDPLRGGISDDAAAPQPPDAAAAGHDASVFIPDAGSADSATACALARSHGTPLCDHCMATKCCAPLAACEANAECVTLETCLIDCFDHDDQRGCYNRCVATHPEGKALWAPLEDCWYGIRERDDHTPTCVIECSYIP